MSENEKLIGLVRDHPILYDVGNKDYKDIARKAEAWADIAAKMNFQSGVVAKNKWRHLRDSYAKYLRTQGNGMGQYSKKYKHWTWAREMQFLKPHVTTRHTDMSVTGNHSDSDTETRVKTEPSLGESPRYYDDSRNEDTAIKSRKQRAEQLSFDAPEETIECFRSGKLPKSKDAMDLLFLSYAQTLKTFSPRRRAAVKLQIAQIINNAEIAQLEENDPLRYSSSPTPSS